MPSPPPILSTTSPSDLTTTTTTFHLTPDEFTTLLQKSTASKSTAYCPYSNFRVGCCLLTTSGTYITGANVENASYPVTTCAERVAFGKAITEGHRGFKAVAVATDIAPPASPCGMCRQFIREFCELSVPIIMFDGSGGYSVMRLEELLPLSFGPEALGVASQTKAADQPSASS
ncbi:cytidine deaminase-like protein [Cercophora newfieldiana]|uniref:Cytidine deaminase n=1 Tax=Cercophora newfieldiana TaxID=92897 RepID=A0AA39YRJ6_9PEZI|nr:cytidine deaminase-like protein [Cercophora newfieldiana]